MTQVLLDRSTLEKALKLAFNLWQTYWAQADSDYVSQQNKSGGTREKFNQLITDTCAALANAERVEPDTQRLDFMFLYDAFLSRTKTDADTIAYQLLAQDEDEDYVVLSGEDKFFPTGRAAVDAAREKAKP